MNRRVPPSFFFNESDADEDLMAEKDAEKATTGLNPDGLWAAHCAYMDVYDGPGSEEAAMANAIKVYLAAMKEKLRLRLDDFRTKLGAVNAELENLRREIEEATT